MSRRLQPRFPRRLDWNKLPRAACKLYPSLSYQTIEAPNTMTSPILLCTVGGSHQPILTAIRERRPAFVLFFCTDKDPGTPVVPAPWRPSRATGRPSRCAGVPR